MNQEQIKATEEALRAWWLDTAAEEVEAVAPKAVEYGSRDLVEMGRTLLRVAGREVTDEEAAEAGIWFYVVGKIARWTAAIERGDRVSDDTLLDIGTYVKMAQRLRVAGSWPGLPEDGWGPVNVRLTQHLPVSNEDEWLAEVQRRNAEQEAQLTRAEEKED